jgi:hypothetical protein
MTLTNGEQQNFQNFAFFSIVLKKLKKSSFVKNQPRARRYQSKTQKVTEAKFLFEIKNAEQNKNRQTEYFLNCFQLNCVKMAISDAIRGYLNDVFKKGNAPSNKNHHQKRLIFKIF